MAKKTLFFFFSLLSSLYILYVLPLYAPKVFNSFQGFRSLQARLIENNTKNNKLILGNSGIFFIDSEQKKEAYKILAPLGGSSRELYYYLKAFLKQHSLRQFRCAFVQVQLFSNKKYFTRWIYRFLNYKWYPFSSVYTLYNSHPALSENLSFLQWSTLFFSAKLRIATWQRILDYFHVNKRPHYTRSFFAKQHKGEVKWLKKPEKADIIFLSYYQKIQNLFIENKIPVTLFILPIPKKLETTVYKKAMAKYVKSLQSIFKNSRTLDISKMRYWDSRFFFGPFHFNTKGQGEIKKIIKEKFSCNF